MSFQDREKKRQCPRTVSLNTVRFCFANDSPGELRLGTTINISTTGMCLYTLNRLKEGQSIVIRDEALLVSKKATVRWVKRYGEKFCRAGLMFVE
jgi:hypothetical protein